METIRQISVFEIEFQSEVIMVLWAVVIYLLIATGVHLWLIWRNK